MHLERIDDEHHRLFVGGKSQAAEKTTLTVWDYYGESTLVKPVLEEFQKMYPDIEIRYEALDWMAMRDKLNVVLTSENVPDVVTIDMTWLPTFAPLDVFVDLKPLRMIPFEQFAFLERDPDAVANQELIPYLHVF